jgi:hypothetical protein
MIPFNLGAYELNELDKYAYVACYKMMIEWIKCLEIKFELVCLDKFIRWHLVSGLNGNMSCKSIQASWVQVWFTFGEI